MTKSGQNNADRKSRINYQTKLISIMDVFIPTRTIKFTLHWIAIVEQLGQSIKWKKQVQKMISIHFYTILNLIVGWTGSDLDSEFISSLSLRNKSYLLLSLLRENELHQTGFLVQRWYFPSSFQFPGNSRMSFGVMCGYGAGKRILWLLFCSEILFASTCTYLYLHRDVPTGTAIVHKNWKLAEKVHTASRE